MQSRKFEIPDTDRRKLGVRQTLVLRVVVFLVVFVPFVGVGALYGLIAATISGAVGLFLGLVFASLAGDKSRDQTRFSLLERLAQQIGIGTKPGHTLDDFAHYSRVYIDPLREELTFLFFEQNSLYAKIAAFSDLAKVKVNIQPAELNEAFSGTNPKFAAAGGLMYGGSGFVVGAVIDGLLRPYKTTSFRLEASFLIEGAQSSVIVRPVAITLNRDSSGFQAEAEAALRKMRETVEVLTKYFGNKLELR